MSTHTPGPWVWVEGSDAINHRWNNLDWTIARVGNHRLGWHEDNNSEGREAGANARLIAASPTMYAFIKKCAASDDKEAIQILEVINA